MVVMNMSHLPSVDWIGVLTWLGVALLFLYSRTENLDEQTSRLRRHCRQRSSLFHGFGGRKDHHTGREEYVLRRLPVHRSEEPRSRARGEQGSRLVQGQDSGGDLRRYQGRRRRTHPRDDGGGISFCAAELNRPCVTAPSSRPVRSAPSLQQYVA